MTDTTIPSADICKQYNLSPEEYENLVVKSQEAQSLAYCPYSKFRVGAVLLTTTGEYIIGTNIENASYPVGVCAERVALGSAVVAGFRDFGMIKAVGVAGDSADPCSPCGMCRQALREFLDPKVPIIMQGMRNESKTLAVLTMGELLPLALGPGHLSPP